METESKTDVSTPEAQPAPQPSITDPTPMETDAIPPAPSKEQKQEATETPVSKPKRVRKKKPKDAPKSARSGYNFFMKEVRPSIFEQNPEANIQEITKLVAIEWNALTDEQKKPYLEQADVEKKRYAEEMVVYKKTKKDQEDLEASISKAEEEEANKSKRENSGPSLMITNGRMNGNANAPSIVPERGQSFNDLLRKRPGDYDIPIFTDDFLEHNKALDSELRTLRKSQTDYEQQNSILEKHVENMQNGVDKLTGDTVAMKETNRILNNYLNKLQLKLVESLSGLSIPSHSQGASLDNIAEYMTDLQNMVTSNSHGPASLNKAKDIIRKADLHIQL